MAEEIKPVEDVKQDMVDDSEKDQVIEEKHIISGEKVENLDESNKSSSMPSVQQEEEAIKKKYGGLLLKKPPLISKDHERAFFDSADWALGKQGGQKPKGPLEALRPKLQRTPQQQMRSRRSAYAPADDSEGDNGTTSSPEGQSYPSDGNNTEGFTSEDLIQCCTKHENEPPAGM